MTLVRFSLITLVFAVIISAVQAQTPPINNDMQQFLQNRLQTLKQTQAQLQADAAANPGNMTAQLNLAETTQEIQQLEAILGVPPQQPTATTPNSLQPSPLQPNPLTPPIPSAGAGIPGVDTHYLQPIKDNLLAELKNIQGTLAQVNAGTDQQFHESLQSQQAELLRQIQDIDQQMKSPSSIPENFIPGMPGAATAPTTPFPLNSGLASPPSGLGTQPATFPGMPMNQEAMNWQNMMNQAQSATIPNPVTDQIKNLENAAQQLRAAGQHVLADQMLQQIEQLRQIGTTSPAPAAVTQPATPSSPEMTAYTSPWMTQPAKEIVELKNSVDSLRAQIEQMQAGINALENQLQLLNRNMVHETGRLDQILNQAPGAPATPTTPSQPLPESPNSAPVQ